MNKFLAFALGALLLSLAGAPAQFTNVRPVPATPPQPPLIRGVPDNSAWTVRIRHASELPADAGQAIGDYSALDAEGEGALPDVSGGEVRRISNEFGKSLRKMVFFPRSGSASTIYLQGQYVFYQHPDLGTPEIMTQMEAVVSGMPFQPDRFQEFGWIGESNYQGIANYRGRECDMYRQTLFDAPRGMYDLPGGVQLPDEAPLSDTPFPPEIAARMKQVIHRTAFIDRKTKLPVALEDSAGIHLYEFKALETPPVLPQNFANALAERQKRVERAERRYKIPQ